MLPPKLCTVFIGAPDAPPELPSTAAPNAAPTPASVASPRLGRPSAPPPMRRVGQSQEGNKTMPLPSSSSRGSLGRSSPQQQSSAVPAKINIPLVHCTIKVLSEPTNLAIVWKSFRQTIIQFQDVGARDRAVQVLMSCVERFGGATVCLPQKRAFPSEQEALHI